MAKAKAEWVQVHGTPLNMSETDGLKPGAFVCVDVREFGDYYGASFETIICTSTTRGLFAGNGKHTAGANCCILI